MKFIAIKPAILAYLAISFVLIGCNTDPSAPQKINDSLDNIAIYYNGNIITMEGDEPVYVEAVVNKDDKIVFLGEKAEAFKKYPTARKNDLEGKTLLPGFIEPHLHPIVGAMMLQTVFVSPYDWYFPWGNRLAIRDRQALVQAIVDADQAMEDPTEILYLWGYQEEIQGQIDKTTLDSINSNRPILLIQYSQHRAYLNSAAIKHYGVDEIKALDNHPQWNAKMGKMEEAAWFLYVVPKFVAALQKPEVLAKTMKQMGELIHLGGVTSAGDIATGLTRDIDREIKFLTDAYDNEETPFRLRLIPDCKSLGTVYNGDNEKVYQKVQEVRKIQTKHLYSNQAIKLFADGAFFAQNMQVLPPGYNDGHTGEWVQEPEKLQEDIAFWWEKEYTIHIHCNGSGGLETILEKCEALQKTHPQKEDMRVSIEHFGQSNEDQIPRLKNINGMVSSNMYYLYTMGDIYSQAHVLGAHRGASLVRMGDLKKYKVPFTFHSDYNMAPLQPLLFMWIAVNRITSEGTVLAPELKLAPYDALKAITWGGAYNMQDEDRLASLKIGKKADYVILDNNPLTIDPMKVKDIKVLGTVFEGTSFPVN